jgi:hypothetical protein
VHYETSGLLGFLPCEVQNCSIHRLTVAFCDQVSVERELVTIVLEVIAIFDPLLSFEVHELQCTVFGSDQVYPTIKHIIGLLKRDLDFGIYDRVHAIGVGTEVPHHVLECLVALCWCQGVNPSLTQELGVTNEVPFDLSFDQRLGTFIQHVPVDILDRLMYHCAEENLGSEARSEAILTEERELSAAAPVDVDVGSQ